MPVPTGVFPPVPGAGGEGDSGVGGIEELLNRLLERLREREGAEGGDDAAPALKARDAEADAQFGGLGSLGGGGLGSLGGGSGGAGLGSGLGGGSASGFDLGALLDRLGKGSGSGSFPSLPTGGFGSGGSSFPGLGGGSGGGLPSLGGGAGGSLPGLGSSGGSLPGAGSGSGGGGLGDFLGGAGGGFLGGGAGGGGSSNDVVSGECKGTTLIFARGTGEPATMGFVVGPGLSNSLRQSLGGDVAVQGVDYAASAAGNAQMGRGAGADKMVQLANQALQKCPDTNLVLSGYSQGAMVVHAALQGGVDGSKVAAVATFGDPLNGQAFRGVDNSKVVQVCGSADALCAGRGQTSGSGGHTSYGSQTGAAAQKVAAIVKGADAAAPAPAPAQ
ncbi:cutinase-domain-containing protein [Elsinoe ampelina]|uniref:Cutinase n=1 Tax=Elsinoe ampelina TaxID=302913 RepID=A0A6A6GCW9_9PEZI|nr:cutinase-domain-containing protein [Elsinoe ampelina]